MGELYKEYGAFLGDVRKKQAPSVIANQSADWCGNPPDF